MEEKISILLNRAIQKFLKIAKCARENQLHGQPDEDEFCLLTRLWSVIWTLQNSPDSLDYDGFRTLEKIVNQIGGREELNYRPILQQPVQEAIKDCCDTISDLWDHIGNIRDIVNYVPPTLQLIPTQFPQGVFEVGYGSFVTDVDWIADKRPLENIRINWPFDPQTVSPNLLGTAPITVNLLTANPVKRTAYGWYNDREAYRGVHKLAEATLVWETKWPCYYGKGPVGALDDTLGRNTFIHSLTKDLDCKKCHDVILGEGEYFYYFYKFEGQKKQFKTENGYIAGSYKGTINDFRTESMVTNAILEGTEYAVIRYDSPGILHTNLCVVDMFGDDPVVEVPNIPEVIIVESFSGAWSGLVCDKV